MTIDKFKSIGINDDRCIDKSYKRIDKNKYFLDIAIAVSKRSHDSNTAHGCVIVKDDRIIATGYNGFPPKSPDNIMPNNRVDKFKYLFISHAEQNAIYSCAKTGVSLDGSSIFITGHPCAACCKMLVSVGIFDWNIGSLGHVSSQEEILLQEFWKEFFPIKINNITTNLQTKY